MVGGKSWNIWYRAMCQRVMQRTVTEDYQVHTASWVPAGTQLAVCTVQESKSIHLMLIYMLTQQSNGELHNQH
jgi:hypothetical protein